MQQLFCYRDKITLARQAVDRSPLFVFHGTSTKSRGTHRSWLYVTRLRV